MSTFDVALLQKKLDDRSARIGVLMGGMSTERNVSLKSGKTVLGALQNRGWTAIPIDVGPDLPFQLKEYAIDVAWIALHGAFGEDGCVQGLLEVMRIPYTGSGVQGSAIAMDKVATKRLLHDLAVRLPKDAVYRTGEPMPADLPFPVIAKTPRGGSTIGIVRCPDCASLEKALVELTELDDMVLVEQIIQGQEITVAVFEGRALPVVMIRPVGSDFFDFSAKYTEGRTEYIVPAPISDLARQDAQAQAKVAYAALGLSGVARADFIVDANDQAWFLEINTIPGMTATSLSPMAAKSVGVSFEELVEQLLLGAKLHNRVAEQGQQAKPGEATKEPADAQGEPDPDRD